LNTLSLRSYIYITKRNRNLNVKVTHQFMQETRQFLHKFAVESVYFSENINNSTIFLEAFKFDVCVSVHHT